MNAPADHRAEALAALRLIQGADDRATEISYASEATAHALLAVEARLGELVEQQRLANVIGTVEVLRAAFLRGRASDADFDRALATVLALLKLPTEES